MNTRTLVTSLAITTLLAPAAGAQERPAVDRLAAAMAEAARATQSVQADVARALALAEFSAEQGSDQREAQAKVREQEAKMREAEAQAREEAARARDLYNQGKSALDRSQWDKARELFAQILAEKGERTDAAQYWMAYAQYRLGQAAAALDSLRQLETSFPKSAWLKDAKVLELELQGATPDSMALSSDEELKLLALSSLVGTAPETALPVLQKVLEGSQPPQVKKRALFVLSQSPSPKAKEILARIAKGAGNPDLQLDALQYLGVFGGADNFKILDEIFASSTDKAVKRRILEAYMIGGRQESLLRAVKAEADPELRRRAVSMLGAGHATDALWEIYRTDKDPAIRRAALEGLFVAADLDRLIEVAKTESDVSLRTKAIQFVGLRKDARATAALLEMYWQKGQTPEIKKSIINGLFVQNNATALIDIAKKETDTAMKKEAVSRLSVMRSKEATDFLLELINK